jgi:dTDP-4-amino-4,6-dideoxygalactose transaminase
VLRSGRLHRYNTEPGEQSQTALLEEEFAACTGAKFALACASGGYAISTALRCLNLAPGAKVLTNAFTLAPVPGAIAGAGGVPIFVNVTPELVIDLDHLAELIQSTGAKHLLLSHMRGHICDMDRLMNICEASSVFVVEDCAHTMGAKWNGIFILCHFYCKYLTCTCFPFLS